MSSQDSAPIAEAQLQELEGARQRAIGLGQRWLAGAIVAAVLVGLWCYTCDAPIAGVVAVTTAIVLGWHQRYRAHQNVVDRFKAELLPIVLARIDPALRYHPGVGLSRHDFQETGLFLRPDRFHSNDLILGQYGATALRLSLVHAEEEYTETHRDANGHEHSETRYRTIFQGLLMIADFNKQLEGRTVVKPRTLAALQLLSGNALTLEDPEFNRHFVAYGNHAVEARYVLTPAFMQALVRLRQQFSFRLACANSTLYFAADLPWNLFEPSLRESFAGGKQVQDLTYTLGRIFGVIDALDLNTRIWNRP